MVTISILLLCSALIRRTDGWATSETTPEEALDLDPDDNKPDLDNEPPLPTTTTTTPTTTTTTPTTTTTTPTTTTTTPTTTTTTPTTTTTTPTTTTTTPTTTTTTPTTTTTTPTTTTTTPTTTTTTPTTTTTTPTTTTTTPTTTTTTPTTTTTTSTTTTGPTTTLPQKKCSINVDDECLESKQLLWDLPDTKELLIFQIRLRYALMLDKQAKIFLLQIPEPSEDDTVTKCIFDQSNGSEGKQCPYELKAIFGFWRYWNELCVVVYPKLQNVTFAKCERRVDCCGDGTKCAPAGFVRRPYLIYCDRYYPYWHPLVEDRTPDVIRSDLFLHYDVNEDDIPSYELDHANSDLGLFFLRHDLLPQGCNCLIRACKKFTYGLK